MVSCIFTVNSVLQRRLAYFQLKVQVDVFELSILFYFMQNFLLRFVLYFSNTSRTVGVQIKIRFLRYEYSVHINKLNIYLGEWFAIEEYTYYEKVGPPIQY